MTSAFQCRCPDKDCTGWRASVSHGGGHIPRDRAMEILQHDADANAQVRPPTPDWPPVGSAAELQDGTQRYGSTGQLFVAIGGQWVRTRGG
jgi:hypothetical protein